MAGPNLFILGAPKCGTTTLMRWLQQHPDVFTPHYKEPHHYYSPYGEPRPRDEYVQLYQDAGDAAVRLDASVWSLFGRTAVPAMLDDEPDARFVVCLRNPVDMVPSLHAQKLLTGHEKLVDLPEAWAAADEREAGSRLGIFGIPTGDPAHMSYKAACRLGEQVRDLLGAVDADRVLFVLLEDTATVPAETWELLCDHAGLEAQPIDFDRANVASVRRRSQLGHRVLAGAGSVKKALGLGGGSGLLAPLHRLNLRADRYSPPSAELRAEMAAYFRDDVELLGSSIDRDLSHWAQPPSGSSASS